jgi:hypothetical protein
MTYPETKKIDLRIFDSLSKCVAVSVGVLYLLGFLAVSAHLSTFGVSSFSIIQLQYLIAGGWVVGLPFAFIWIVRSARAFEVRAVPEASGKFNWRRFLFSMFLPAIPLTIFVAILVVIPGALQEMTWWAGIRLYLFVVAIMSSADFLWMSWKIPTEKETWLVNRQSLPFHISLLSMLVLSYVLWFGVRIYPMIPFAWGGGRPLRIAFIAGEKRLPDVIKAESILNRSVPYELLATTERSYIVVSPATNEESIEVSRESVVGIIVLKEPHAQ